MATNDEIKESIKSLQEQRKALQDNTVEAKAMDEAIASLNEKLVKSIDH